jgi:hypothetical protein
MDRTQDSGSCDVGSIPTGCTKQGGRETVFSRCTITVKKRLIFGPFLAIMALWIDFYTKISYTYSVSRLIFSPKVREEGRGKEKSLVRKF